MTGEIGCAERALNADADAKKRKIQKRLQTIKKEKQAIKAALESLDHHDESEGDAGEPGEEGSAKLVPDAQQEQQQQLQRATLTDRLQGLQAKREQLTVCPGTLLLHDRIIIIATCKSDFISLAQMVRVDGLAEGMQELARQAQHFDILSSKGIWASAFVAVWAHRLSGQIQQRCTPLCLVQHLHMLTCTSNPAAWSCPQSCAWECMVQALGMLPVST